MHIMLFNCLDRLKDDLTGLFRKPEMNVYLAISQDDIIRILNTSRIDSAVLWIPDIDNGMLQVLHAYSQTQFFLLGTSLSKVVRYDNLHAFSSDGFKFSLHEITAQLTETGLRKSGVTRADVKMI